MPHIHDLTNIHLQQPSVLTVGVFDGVHRGHQYLIRQLVESAHAQNRQAVVLTFFPHPDQVRQNIRGRYYLTTDEERAALLLKLGVDYVVTQPFDATTRQTQAKDFVNQLVEQLDMKELWVGADFALGHNREGNVTFLTRQGIKKGYTVQVIDLLQTENPHNVIITSTLIRDALIRGDVEQAQAWLGRAYAISGPVVKGARRGHTIGFPTANLAVWDQQIIPANGVYAGWANLGNEHFMTVTNIGVRPTFDHGDVTVEAHLLDFRRDLYGATLTVTFEKQLRPEMKFADLPALIEQINVDIEKSRAYLSCHLPI